VTATAPRAVYGAVSGAAPNSPSHRAITTDARQLPTRLSDVRAMSIRASTPRMTATPSSGSPNCVSVPARITSDARGTAARPLLVSISVSIMSTWRDNGIAMPAAWATNTEARAR